MKIYYHTAYTNDPRDFAAISHGMSGYNDVRFDDQSVADKLNAMQGITPAQASAACTCSMNDDWNRFDLLAEELEAAHENPSTL